MPNTIIPALTVRRGTYIDSYGIEMHLNSQGYRTLEFSKIDYHMPRVLAMGCSHTMGNGNIQSDIWPEQLKEKININQIINLGQEGASSDYVVRILPVCLEYFRPSVVFVFWPDYVRFEINNGNNYQQVLVTDKDRIQYCETHNEEWLLTNYQNQLATARNLCQQYNARLIGISWDDLIPYMDHADKWRRSIDGSHYDSDWHKGVADVFKNKFIRSNNDD